MNKKPAVAWRVPSMYHVGQEVIVHTQGLAIPGHDARTWSTAHGKIVQVTPTVGQFSYSVVLTEHAEGATVVVRAHNLRLI